VGTDHGSNLQLLQQHRATASAAQLPNNMYTTTKTS
jgi:hypothetical protein